MRITPATRASKGLLDRIREIDIGAPATVGKFRD